ncbi:porin [Lysobacter sp. CFH 32150]|uniref:OprO/OprP family phosphate-selective porin n=1 Tax=Lysobacter sp. CFH 32150 TaxID=2927128 RepID=UPI001FA8092F|nr:porin [Lysobacter sp. CFH 32150]MCI4569175.1 porin [Lysobacter sp. CFH 32150]
MAVHHSRLRLSTLALALLSAPAFAQSPAPAQSNPAQTNPPTIEELARRLQALEQRLGGEATTTDTNTVADIDQRLRVLERKLELQAEEAAAKAAKDPVVALSAAKGLSVKSPAAEGVEVKFKGLVQADGRVFIDDEQQPQNDGFLLRRVEPTIEGSWGPLVGFRIQAQLAGDNATLNDAYADIKFDPRATARVGKFKAPVGLEQLQSSSGLAGIERGLPTELTPARDYGVQLQGEFNDSTLSYAVGLFNGTPDGRDGPSSNPDNEFEIAGRVFWEPFKNDASALSGLGFGVAGSAGEKRGSGNSFLPRYRTPGQVTFFNYRSAVVADGDHVRWSPQAYYYRNAFGLQAEYISSKQEVLLPATNARDDLDHRAWQVTAGYVLTGEDAGYKGVVKPNHSFTFDGAGWGAFELVARYGELTIDRDAFPRFADANTVAAAATTWGLGLNWYLNSNLKFVANYLQTDFEGGAADYADREDEKAFFTRAQFSF